MSYNFDIRYEGPKEQEEAVVALFQEQSRLMGPFGLVPEELADLVDEVVIHQKDNGQFVAEFNPIPDSEYCQGENSFYIPGDPNDKRLKIPKGFYIAESSTPESIVMNLWRFMRDNGIGQSADGEYPVGQIDMTIIEGVPKELLTEQQKKQMIPRANGSFGYRSRARVQLTVVPYDDQRRSMTDMWYLCEPSDDMSAGEMAKQMSEIIRTGMLLQLTEKQFNESVWEGSHQLVAYERAILNAASHSTFDGITQDGVFTFYGLARLVFCKHGRDQAQQIMDQYRKDVATRANLAEGYEPPSCEIENIRGFASTYKPRPRLQTLDI